MSNARNTFVAIAIFVVTTIPPLSAADKIPHLDAAESLVKDLQPDQNEYAYDDIHIKWRGDQGVMQSEARCDCSGLLTLLLEHVYGYTPAQFKKWTGHSRPLARIYHDQIEAEKGFKRIKNIADIQPGDILAVKYEAATKDTGHVMIVAESPRRRDATAPMEEGTFQWEVVIIDSSKSGHGPTDTRRKPDKTFYTGVGKGTIRLYTNAHGEFAGYTWSTLKASEFYAPADHHLVVGRLQKDFKP